MSSSSLFLLLSLLLLPSLALPPPLFLCRAQIVMFMQQFCGINVIAVRPPPPSLPLRLFLSSFSPSLALDNCADPPASLAVLLVDHLPPFVAFPRRRQPSSASSRRPTMADLALSCPAEAGFDEITALGATLGFGALNFVMVRLPLSVVVPASTSKRSSR